MSAWDYQRIMDAVLAWKEAQRHYPRTTDGATSGTVQVGEHEFAKPPKIAAIRADGTGPQFKKRGAL